MREIGFHVDAGCEFFKDYKDNGYNAVALKFDWKQVHMFVIAAEMGEIGEHYHSSRVPNSRVYLNPGLP